MAARRPGFNVALYDQSGGAPALPHLTSGIAISAFGGDTATYGFSKALDRNTATFHTSDSIASTWYVDLVFDNPTQLQEVKVTCRSGVPYLAPGRFRRYYKDTAGGSYVLDGQGYISCAGYPLTPTDLQVLDWTFAVTVGSHAYWRLEADNNPHGDTLSGQGNCSMAEMFGYETTGGTDMFA